MHTIWLLTSRRYINNTAKLLHGLMNEPTHTVLHCLSPITWLYMYKWVLANLTLREVTIRLTSIPSKGSASNSPYLLRVNAFLSIVWTFCGVINIPTCTRITSTSLSVTCVLYLKYLMYSSGTITVHCLLFLWSREHCQATSDFSLGVKCLRSRDPLSFRPWCIKETTESTLVTDVLAPH